MRIQKMLLPLLVVYGLYAAFMHQAQTDLLFPDTSDRRDAMTTMPAGAQRVEIRLRYGTARAVYWAPHDTGARHAAIWYAHGNFETVADSYAMIQPLLARGIAVMQYEFPGYGGSDGAPEAAMLEASSRATWDWLAARPEVDANRMVAMGYSIGGGVAAALTEVRPVRALVLLSTYDSLGAMAHRYVLPAALLKYPYDNLARVAAFHGDVFIEHGKRDRVIPFAAGQKLAAASNATFVALDCGHADCDFATSIFATRLPDALTTWHVLP